MNQLELPSPGPTFELSFASHHVGRTLKLFGIDESRHSVVLREALDKALLMFEDAPLQVAGRADA
jgi:hypothetical protein